MNMENLSPSARNIGVQEQPNTTAKPLTFGSCMLQATVIQRHEKKAQLSRNVRQPSIPAIAKIQHVHMTDENGVHGF